MLIAGWIPKVRRLCEWAYVRLSQELYKFSSRARDVGRRGSRSRRAFWVKNWLWLRGGVTGKPGSNIPVAYRNATSQRTGYFRRTAPWAHAGTLYF